MTDVKTTASGETLYPVRLLANWVQITVAEQTPNARDARRVVIEVDQYGYVNFPRITTHEKGKHTDAYLQARDWLMDDLELIEWLPIGPEDSELFLTDKAHKMFKEQLAALGGDWREWERA